jgi:hypothetical protein
MLSKDAFKSGRFRIWGIGLLIVVVAASIFFAAHLARQPSEPFVSVSFGRANFYGPVISIEVSNRMSFTVSCSIEPEVLRSGKWESGALMSGNITPLRLQYSLKARSNETSHILQPHLEGVRARVSYERELKPIEASVLNKLPWLKGWNPFNRRRSFTVYESVKLNGLEGRMWND